MRASTQAGVLGCVSDPSGKSRFGQLNRHENGGVHEPIYIKSMKPAVLPAEPGMQSMATDLGLVSGVDAPRPNR